MKVDFLIPCRIESEDRLRNVITSVTYLLSKFPQSNVIVKEVDSQSQFTAKALPIIRNYANIERLKLQFEKSDEKFFHKTRILNDLLYLSDSETVCNYDVDIVIPQSSLLASYNAISNGWDCIYPFGCGIYQWAVNYSTELMNKFISTNFDLNLITNHSIRRSSTVGWGQMLKRKVEINAGLWNENFISWGAEDCEFYYRLNALGYKVGRVNGDIFHFEHSRTFNSHYHNPKFTDNYNLWQWIRTQDKESLLKYYQNQDYIRKRNEIYAGI